MKPSQPNYDRAGTQRDRVGWLTVIARFMAAVLMALSVVSVLQWIAIVAVSGFELVRHQRWPNEALPYWFHIVLPIMALVTWRLGRWVAS